MVKLYADFQLCEGQVPTPLLFKGQLYCVSMDLMHTHVYIMYSMIVSAA